MQLSTPACHDPPLSAFVSRVIDLSEPPQASLGFANSCPQAIQHCVVIVGGDFQGTKLSDTWIYDPNPSAKKWIKLTTFNAPGARSGAAIVTSPDG